MTLALKDFKTVKELFSKKIEVILLRETENNKGKTVTVEDLPSKRRHEIQFLQSILKELDAQIATRKPKDLKPYTTIFYGAMLLIQKDIIDNLSTVKMEKKENSLLYTSLDDLIGVTETTDLSLHQKAECYQALNKFLSLIFNENNSLKGLKKEHALQTLPDDKSITPKKLAALVKSSYQLEEQAVKARNKAMPLIPADKQTAPGAMEKVSSIPSVDKFTNWTQLTKDLESLIQKELADKNVSNVLKLDAPRAAQLQFLQNIVASISEKQLVPWLKEADKVAILAGAMHIVRAQINLEYSQSLLFKDELPKSLLYNKSVIHSGLTKILKTEEEDFENIEALITFANHFICHATIETSKKMEPVNKKSGEMHEVVSHGLRSEHIFSKIKEFQLFTLLDLVQDMIKACRDSALNRCMEAIKPKKESSSWYGSWWHKSKATTDEEEELTDDEEEKVDATASTASTSTTTPSMVSTI